MRLVCSWGTAETTPRLSLALQGLYLKFWCDFQVSSADKSQTNSILHETAKKAPCALQRFSGWILSFLLCKTPEFNQCSYGRHAQGHPSLSQTSLILPFPSNSPCKYKSPNSLCTSYWQMPKLKMATKRQLNCSKSSPLQSTAPPVHASAVLCCIPRWFPYLSGVLGSSTILLCPTLETEVTEIEFFIFIFWDVGKNFIVVVELEYVLKCLKSWSELFFWFLLLYQLLKMLS